MEIGEGLEGLKPPVVIPPITEYLVMELPKAVVNSLEGNVSLHLMWEPTDFDRERAPLAFKRAKSWGHLLCQDERVLRQLAAQLGVKRVMIHGKGLPKQHVDLCGEPLRRARTMCNNAAMPPEGNDV